MWTFRMVNGHNNIENNEDGQGEPKISYTKFTANQFVYVKMISTRLFNDMHVTEKKKTPNIYR